MSTTRKTFKDILNDIETEHTEYTQSNEMLTDELVFDVPINDYDDVSILMHKDAHFGGSFSVMLEYYNNPDAPGVQEEFSINRIHELQEIEQSKDLNLSDSFLSPQDKALVLRSFQTYAKLKTITEESSNKNSIAYLISELILSEDEYPEKEIENLVKLGNTAVKDLIALIENLDFWNPLFPGYGNAPLFAIEALSAIKDPASLEHIFACVKRADFFAESQIMKAILSFGEDAKEFLVKVLSTVPISEDNTHAALCLQFFKDPKVSNLCFKLLQSDDLQLDSTFAQHLLLNLENLDDTESLANWAQEKSLPPQLQEEVRFILSLKKKK
ncbi:MAG: hypothetical protein L7U87_02650 [Chlamydiales bacterium]|nr:hypothetical protein [Chlamydiales bacterium]